MVYSSGGHELRISDIGAGIHRCEFPIPLYPSIPSFEVCFFKYTIICNTIRLT
ncbi:hypothetical protein KC19_VG284800 [Ceratodon purpureus]|uniref:Uncharacterized protein n=1 Tax=Ceratodon purpureus TaxID=3225 RepID=A0A8T0HUQ0_CERPU|nr:hypothetical protein KC19_VG284800 [Ceratodon purpureus]KAG0574714.1 hypothetical protein KC19_VG284800 [Ceratodon purpureus]